MAASWPISVKSFTAKADITDINYAAHINAIQEEVVALETYLGLNPHISTVRATTYASVLARLEDIETDYSLTSHNHTHNSLTGLTTGDPHTQYILKTLLAAKGGILTASGSGAVEYLAVGVTDGMVLEVLAGASYGIQWGTPAVKIAGSTMTGNLSVKPTGALGKAIVGGSGDAGLLSIERDGATASGADIGVVDFYGQDSGNNRTRYVRFYAKATDNTNGGEDGEVDFRVLKANVETSLLLLQGTQAGPILPTNTILSSDGLRSHTWGTGSPEGVVTARIGSTYGQTNGTTGTALWIKESGTGNTGWKAGGSKTVRLAWTYSLPGTIAIPSGAVDFLPPSSIAVPTGQAVTLVGYRWVSYFGTSFSFKIQHYTGATLATVTDLVGGTAGANIVAAAASVKGSGTFAAPQACADQDAWAPVITAVSGSPSGGAVTMLADVTF